MSATDTESPKVAFAKEWFARGECPGCGAPLAKVAGRGSVHVSNGDTSHSGPLSRIGDDGRPASACPWSADDLTSLVLIATNFGRDLPPDPSPVGPYRGGRKA